MRKSVSDSGVKSSPLQAQRRGKDAIDGPVQKLQLLAYREARVVEKRSRSPDSFLPALSDDMDAAIVATAAWIWESIILGLALNACCHGGLHPSILSDPQEGAVTLPKAEN